MLYTLPKELTVYMQDEGEQVRQQWDGGEGSRLAGQDSGAAETEREGLPLSQGSIARSCLAPIVPVEISSSPPGTHGDQEAPRAGLGPAPFPAVQWGIYLHRRVNRPVTHPLGKGPLAAPRAKAASQVPWGRQARRQKPRAGWSPPQLRELVPRRVSAPPASHWGQAGRRGVCTAIGSTPPN